MTFVLKELNELRRYFDDTVKIMLSREGKGKIEDLADPRKCELQFLSSALLKLEEVAAQVKVEEPSHKKAAKAQQTPSTAPQATIFYGAMLTIIKDIDNQRGIMDSAGLLSNRLTEVIVAPDTKAEDKPDLYQTAEFYTTLNAFLSQVFVDNDSRKGFARDHMLVAVSTDNLNRLMKTSYKLEKEAQLAINASLVADGKSTANINKYKDQKDLKKSPLSATERFGSWDNLNSELDNIIIKELGDKNVSKIDKLSKQRAAQLHFLNAIRDALKPTKAIEEPEKVAILAGAMHLVRKQIIDEYAASYIGKLENSVIYKELSKTLGAEEVNPQDTEALVTSATQFIRFMTIEPKTNGKKAIRTNNIFSAIAGFELKASLNLLIDMVHTCRADALKHAVVEFKKLDKAPEKPATYLGSLTTALTAWNMFNKPKAGSEDEEEEPILEHKI